MELITYLRALTPPERKVLAEEIGSTHKYIRKLSTGQGSASIGLFAAIRQSKFNKRLSPKIKLKKEDEVAYRLLKASVSTDE